MPARITKITLHGFKSFGKRICVPFLPGFNVITGPNGVGKSNIIDGISFVLGITSAKSLRASKLSELIFNGGKKGNAASYAKVTLWLDNSDGIFPSENGEISISRKVNRKGISVYKLNGKTVTRSQILDVLSNARIYPDGHNIIHQGDVTRVIEMNPVERRGIIDEIAGIAEYDEKKERAKKNLEEVEQKLREIEIILSERFETLKRLETERNIALKYRELTEELEKLQASLVHQYMKLGLSKFQQLDVKINQIEKELEGVVKEI
ncbi:MAG TPA: chromosome segregation protein SMC, partial [Candidatus Aenigmarchaeota archaeon]|nr:chromosome segregation protein SMC [Candidatus Aenigmarchaeota archaeon]